MMMILLSMSSSRTRLEKATVAGAAPRWDRTIRLLFIGCRAAIAVSWTLLSPAHSTGCSRERLLGCQHAVRRL